MAKSKYYNYNKVCSYNAIYNLIAGGRGIGKTFGAKEKAIVNAIKKGEQFIYLRRYKTELQAAVDTFFADIVARNLFPEWDFKVHGKQAFMSPIHMRDDKKRQWTLIGYFIALSTAQNQKSVAFPLVTMIIYDEFIIEKNTMHYLPNEATVFNNFYSTVNRDDNGRVKVFFLANSVSITNPYFVEWRIEPKAGEEWLRLFDGFIVCHFPKSEEFNSEFYKTRFGKFIEGSEYANYAVENNFADNHDGLLERKTSRATYLMTLESRYGTLSIWHDVTNGKYYVQDSLPKRQNIYTMLLERMQEDKTFITYNNRILQNLRTAFAGDKMRFDKAATRQNFFDIFRNA